MLKKINLLFYKKNMTHFFTQLNLLYSAGIHIYQCIYIIEQYQNEPHLKESLQSMRKSLQSGLTLSEIFSQFPEHFDTTTCQLINLGQHSGNLEKILQQIQHYHEQKTNLQQEITHILLYPLIIITITTVIFIFLLLVVIPKFALIYQQTSAPLPISTQYLFMLSNFIEKNFFLLSLNLAACCGILTITSFLQWLPHPKHLPYYLPVIKKYYLKSMLARFSYHLNIALSSGLPIDQAIILALQILPPCLEDQKINRILPLIQSGKAIHIAMASSPFFPVFYRELIKTGETAGKLEAMLINASKLLEKDVQRFLFIIKKSAEPLIMLGLGVVIGVIILSLYLPIFNLGNTI